MEQWDNHFKTTKRNSSKCPYILTDLYIPLIDRERDHYREISDRGLGVLNEQQRGQCIKAEV